MYITTNAPGFNAMTNFAGLAPLSKSGVALPRGVHGAHNRGGAFALGPVPFRPVLIVARPVVTTLWAAKKGHQPEGPFGDLDPVTDRRRRRDDGIGWGYDGNPHDGGVDQGGDVDNSGGVGWDNGGDPYDGGVSFGSAFHVPWFGIKNYLGVAPRRPVRLA
ncbi:MAG: hypothetical protein HQM16_06800 [Deltaproteobacteria bacterium]|nr:hypothetical protein [Deltaproteobacteria bacterium]